MRVCVCVVQGAGADIMDPVSIVGDTFNLLLLHHNSNTHPQ